MTLKVAIIGASGYSGAELVRILKKHPRVSLEALMADSSAGSRFSDLYPGAKGLEDRVLEKIHLDSLSSRAGFVFLALPHTFAMKIAPALLKKGLKVVDLSGDFRLKDPLDYPVWYKEKHKAPALLKEAVYGLPELNREKIRKARLVANPGCYATGVILAFLPMLKAGAADLSSLIADCKSGVSGAGRKLALNTHFCEVSGNFSAYKVAGAHQHVPEIEQVLGQAAGRKIRLCLTPHLLPLNRGILTTAYAGLKKKFASTGHLKALYARAYAREPFVKVLDGEALPDLRSAKGTNFCNLAVRVDSRTGRAVVISCLDNLVKGAAGQAVQNMNLMCGFKETEGLETPGCFV